MRLKIVFKPEEEFVRFANKHAIQGFIYNMLNDSPYGERHDEPHFKFFTFSDIFIDSHGRPTLLVSSPDEKFIEELYSNIHGREEVYIGKYILHVIELRKFSLKLKRKFQTGSPIVLYKDSTKNEYFKIHEHRDMNFFIRRLKENALKKYRVFYGEEFDLEGPIFDRMVPKIRRNGKIDVYVKVVKYGTSFPIIGSKWELLEKEQIKPEDRKFYRFIMDAGLGEKNSLGFGFLNPISEKLLRKKD